jgi:hypothetical protein
MSVSVQRGPTALQLQVHRRMLVLQRKFGRAASIREIAETMDPRRCLSVVFRHIKELKYHGLVKHIGGSRCYVALPVEPPRGPAAKPRRKYRSVAP